MSAMLSDGFRAALQTGTAPLRCGGDGALLAVDDEPAITASIADQLHRRYHVLTAGGGEEALAILRTETVSALPSARRSWSVTVGGSGSSRNSAAARRFTSQSP